MLYACVSDEAGNVTKGQAHFNWETTAPDVASVTWSQNGSIFTLSGYTDQDGSGLATNNTDTCTAAKYSTCSVTIYDRAGNSATATTPINDPGMGDVNVSFAGSVTESPLPPTAKITLETGQASITAWRYSWTNFQYDQASGKYICSGGNEIKLATYSAGQPFQPPENIARGQAKLYSCVTDVIGNDKFFEAPYYWDYSAKSGSITGPEKLKQGESAQYTLTLNGSWEGEIKLSNGAVCLFTLDDYNAVTGQSACTFTVTASDSGIKTLEIFAANGIDGLSVGEIKVSITTEENNDDDTNPDTTPEIVAPNTGYSDEAGLDSFVSIFARYLRSVLESIAFAN